MGKPRSQWYVGVLLREKGQHYSHRIAFRIAAKPTPEVEPAYSYVIGPFRSGRAAKLCASLPGSTMQTVSEWERFAKVTNGVRVFGVEAGGEIGV
jgi:hypothetical protein